MPEPSKRQQELFNRLRETDPNAKVRWSEKTGVPVQLSGKLSAAQTGAPADLAIKFFAENRELFVIRDPATELKLTRVGAGTIGNQFVKFQQMFKQLPVFGHELVVHFTRNNEVKRVNGHFTPNIELVDKPRVSAEEALKAALSHDKKNHGRPDHDPILMVLIHEDKPHLVWQTILDGEDTDLRGKPMPARWVYFVDGMTGKVVWRYNNEQTHGSTTGTGTGLYAGAVPLNTYHNHTDTTYQLEDRSTPGVGRIYTYNADDGWPPSTISQDSNNNWSAVGQNQEVDCHFYTRAIFDYFLAEHGRNGYDNAGADILIYADVKWDNSSWNGSYVKIGNGDGATNPQCALDVIAHEWTHAVTENEANLTYNGESGALNESFSDIFACLIDGGWLYGEDYWTGAGAPAARNLADPTNGGQYDPTDPITSVLAGHQPDHTDDQYTGGQDYGGVHINSGIMNKAAFLIAEGGIHRGIRICVPLGRDRLGHLYYEVLTGGYLNTGADFEDMREAVLDALATLYSGHYRYNRWRASVINAFAAVGIGEAVSCPMVCFVFPIDVVLDDIVEVDRCLVAPHIVCVAAPSLVECWAAPIRICPAAPIEMGCAPAPVIGCLPGPDPLPFDPTFVEKIITRDILIRSEKVTKK